MQHKPAHGCRSNGLNLARDRSRRHHPRGLKRPQELPQKQRVTTRRRMTRPAEFLLRPPAESLPRQNDRSRRAQRPRIQHNRRWTRRHLRPQTGRPQPSKILCPAREHHRDRQPLDPLRQIAQEAQRLPVGPLTIVDQNQ